MARTHNALTFLTQNETSRLLASSLQHGFRSHVMVLLAYRHGLRASELCGARLDDIDLAGGHILCRRGKGSVSNWQELRCDEQIAVQRWTEERNHHDSPFLFPGRWGGPLSRQQFFLIFQRLAARAQIPPGKRHPHVLKHSLGTHLANAGVPPQVIQQRLGHRSISSTMIYLAVASEYVDRTVASAIDAGAVV